MKPSDSPSFPLIQKRQSITTPTSPNEDVCTPANLAHASEGYERIDWNTADDGSGERIELEAPLSANRESSRVNERRLFAVWAA